MNKLPAVIHPKMVVSPHPLSASVGRKLLYNNFLPGESLGGYLRRLDLIPTIPENFVLLVSGRKVSFDDINRIYPHNGDLIVMRACVHGGDGDSNKTLRTVLMIAVIAASYGGAGAWVGLMTQTGLAAGTAIVMVGGMLLISALVPVKIPSFDEAQPSPTYSLTGGANRARPYEPLPLVFGTVRMYPDHGARPYTEYQGRDQVLIQIFNFGLSDVVYGEMKIGNTLLTNFTGMDDGPVTIEESPDFTGALTLYPGNVDTLPGTDLVANAGVFTTKTSSPDTTRLVIDISGLNYFEGREEGLTEARIMLEAEYSVTGLDVWQPFFYHFFLGDFSIRGPINGDRELMRLSYSRTVTKGTYDVRVRLLDQADVVYHTIVCDEEGENCVDTLTFSPRGLNNGGMVQAIAWDALKSYQSDESDYTNQKRIAMAIKANAQLNGRVDAFNVIASSRILIWDYVNRTWDYDVSSNPAWQFLSLARGKHSNDRRLYGAGLSDNRIDLETIKLWGEWCDDKNLECNIVFDGKMTVIDMLNTIARCGRATSTWSNGTLGVVYDRQNLPATAVFGMSNIIRGSFQVNYITINQVDEIVIAFNNPDINWQRDTVRAVVPGVTSPVNSITVEIPGITSEVQAGREANLLAAEQFYRRRLISWESDIEGLTVQRGEVAMLSHDVTQWDYSGRLVSGTVLTLELDRTVPFSPATQHYIGVRLPDGTLEIVDVTLPGVENLIEYPEDLTNVAWVPAGVTVEANVANSPDGKLEADKVTADGISSFSQLVQNQTEWIPGATTLTASIHINNIDLAEFVLYAKNNTTTDVLAVEFDMLSDPPVYSSTVQNVNCTLDSTSVDSLGFGWYRLSMTVTFGTSFGATDSFKSGPHLSWAATSTKSAYLWGAMLNYGDLAAYLNKTDILDLMTPLSISPNADLNNEPVDYMWVFGPKETPGKLVKITDITPLSEHKVRITATDEEDDYYLAEETEYTYIPPGSFIDGIPAISNLALGESLTIVGSGFGSVVNVSWTVTGEYGGAFIRAGDQDVPIRDIGRTLDTSFKFEWAVGKTVTVEVICYSLNFESSDISKATDSLLLVGKAAPPSDVSNFVALQNGGSVILKWDQPPDIDLAGTEIRYSKQGAECCWENAVPLTRVTKGTNITTQDIVDGDWTFYAKHVDTSNNYSINAASSLLSFNSSLDIVTQIEQAPTWPGTLVNFIVHHTGVLVPHSQEADSDDGALVWDDDTVFAIFVNNPYVECTYEAAEIDIGFDDTVRIWGDIQSALGPLELGLADPKLSIDYRTAAGSYDGFEDWSVGNALCRYVKHKLTMNTDSGAGYVFSFLPTVDLLERVTSEQFVIAPGGTTVTFAQPFHTVPFGTVSAISAGTALFATIGTITTTSALVHVYNLSGTSVGGVAILTLTGV